VWSVCVSVFVHLCLLLTLVSPAKMVKPIRCRLGWGDEEARTCYYATLLCTDLLYTKTLHPTHTVVYEVLVYSKLIWV